MSCRQKARLTVSLVVCVCQCDKHSLNPLSLPVSQEDTFCLLINALIHHFPLHLDLGKIKIWHWRGEEFKLHTWNEQQDEKNCILSTGEFCSAAIYVRFGSREPSSRSHMIHRRWNSFGRVIIVCIITHNISHTMPGKACQDQKILLCARGSVADYCHFYQR